MVYWEKKRSTRIKSFAVKLVRVCAFNDVKFFFICLPNVYQCECHPHNQCSLSWQPSLFSSADTARGYKLYFAQNVHYSFPDNKPSESKNWGVDQVIIEMFVQH